MLMNARGNARGTFKNALRALKNCQQLNEAEGTLEAKRASRTTFERTGTVTVKVQIRQLRQVTKKIFFN